MMQTHAMKNDTASFIGDVLPAILNEDSYWPSEPRSLQETGLPETLVEALVCQQLLNVGTLSGRNLSERIGLSYNVIEQQLSALRVRQLITHARPAPLNDFYYSLTENGHKRATIQQKSCSYSGPAPVPLMDYVLSVEAQATHFEPVTERKLKSVLENVTYDPTWLDFLGPAVNSTSGIFLYGAPGNGKTTLAKCLTACRGSEIWIPHAIIEDGSIIKFFDATYHTPSGSISSNSRIVAAREYDRRWIRIRRPTVVVGGELTLDNLEVRHDSYSNTSEAPLQLKSNCGCLLIDDFGRQRVAPADLLNRWIIPLESRTDFLTLATGKKISVPFEQTILFSTNLQPESLVDEAFLRRVPFKIEIGDPGRGEYIELFRRACEAMEIHWRPEIIEQFIDRQYKATGRPLRRCHPRDLLLQINALAAYRDERPELRLDYLELACNNYFGSNTANMKHVALPRPSASNTRSATPNGAMGPASVPVNTQRLVQQESAPKTQMTAKVTIAPVPHPGMPLGEMTQRLPVGSVNTGGNIAPENNGPISQRYAPGPISQPMKMGPPTQSGPITQRLPSNPGNTNGANRQTPPGNANHASGPQTVSHSPQTVSVGKTQPGADDRVPNRSPVANAGRPTPPPSQPNTNSVIGGIKQDNHQSITANT